MFSGMVIRDIPAAFPVSPQHNSRLGPVFDFCTFKTNTQGVTLKQQRRYPEAVIFSNVTGQRQKKKKKRRNRSVRSLCCHDLRGQGQEGRRRMRHQTGTEVCCVFKQATDGRTYLCLKTENETGFISCLSLLSQSLFISLLLLLWHKMKDVWIYLLPNYTLAFRHILEFMSPDLFRSFLTI